MVWGVAGMLPTPKRGWGTSAWGKLFQPARPDPEQGLCGGEMEGKGGVGCGLRTWEDEGEEIWGVYARGNGR